MVTTEPVNEIPLTDTGVSFSFVRTSPGMLKISKGIGHCPMVLETASQLPPVETGGLRRSRDRLNLIRTKGACQTVRGLVPRTQALFVPAG